MNPPETGRAAAYPPAAALLALPRIPVDSNGPVFAEPWQAQAFALAVKLSEQGHFSWTEWAAALLTRKNEWAEAYRHTPHGRPVELGDPGT